MGTAAELGRLGVVKVKSHSGKKQTWVAEVSFGEGPPVMFSGLCMGMRRSRGMQRSFVSAGPATPSRSWFGMRVLGCRGTGSANTTMVRSGKNVLYRDFRVPDECPRLGKSRWHVAARRLHAGRDGGRSALRFLQHLQHPG